MFHRPHHPHRHTLVLAISFILVCASLLSYGWWKQTQVQELNQVIAEAKKENQLLRDVSVFSTCPTEDNEDEVLAACRNALSQVVDLVDGQYELHQGECTQASCVFRDSSNGLLMGSGVVEGYYKQEKSVTDKKVQCDTLIVSSVGAFSAALSELATQYPSLIKKDGSQLTISVSLSTVSSDELSRIKKTSNVSPLIMFGRMEIAQAGACGSAVTIHSIIN